MTENNVIKNTKAVLEIKYGIKPATTVVHVDTKRPLTSGEIKMCQAIFRNSIDYSKVYIQVGGLITAITSTTGNAMTPAGQINLPTKDYYKTRDFSKALPNQQHWFIHEMLHVWQYQLGAKNAWLGIKQLCKGGYTSEVNSADSGQNELKSYDTDLLGRDSEKKFNEFNFEQQGRIIEFWFDANYLQHNLPSRRHHQKSLQLFPILIKILTDFLCDPTDKKLLPK
ncbi:zinc protease [Acinetobacter bereziniae]|uniref:zinc protease n=1 Tax=Acinetobacter bereziniae TaxID=106648 RepID=UPI003AF852E4